MTDEDARAPLSEDVPADEGAPIEGTPAEAAADEEQIAGLLDDERPRRSKLRRAPEAPSGWRGTRRRSKSRKVAKRAQAEYEVKEKVTDAVDTAGRVAWLTWRMVWTVVGVTVAVSLGLYLAATGVNGLARWMAKRAAERAQSAEGQSEAARDNLLVIAKDGGVAYGFLALRVEPEEQQVWGLAIPAAVFVEVPGQGLEKVGESLIGGPDVAMAAVSNFLGVRFDQYVVVDKAIYQSALEKQSVAGMIAGQQDTNLTAEAKTRFASVMDVAAGSRIGLAPLPVKPLSLGDEEYLEPQTEAVADLLAKWWDVTPESAAERVRIIVYNGAGVPGIGGVAAKQLIKAGFRVVSTGNADNFNYRETIITVETADAKPGEDVRRALGGVGKVSQRESTQGVADVIVIIGKDYKPPAGE
ncbi:MAG: LytR family transcriptional regulator [Actinobacteria bacterium]|nr:MAG: LytR family transcriptional regulator [Actinomycetota bacterium]